MRLPLYALLSCLTILLASCGSITINQEAKNAITKQSQIYVVKPADSDRDIEKFVSDAFMRRGYHVSTGPQAQMPSSTSHYVTFVDRWYWDMSMYLVSLDIILHDRKAGNVIGAGSYRNATFHGFPSPSGTADSIVGQILGEKDE